MTVSVPRNERPLRRFAIRGGTGIILLIVCLIAILFPIIKPQQKLTSVALHPPPSLPQDAAVTTPIFVDGTNPYLGWDDWSWVKGSGTFADPYVIANLTIDGDMDWTCISIANTREYFRVENCTLYNSGWHPNAGIYLSNVTNGVIQDNHCIDNRAEGIFLSSSNNCTLSGNTCLENVYNGIYLNSSANNTLLGNNCSGNGDNGIFLSLSENCTLSGNLCTGNSIWGILLSSSSNCTLTGNLLELCGLFLEGPVSSTLSTSIDATNTVNGNPLRFLASISGVVIPGNTGEVILVNCSGITINQLLNPGVCIHLINSSNNYITGNNCTGFYYGIYLNASDNNTLSGNNCTENYDKGIYLSSSANNTLSGNTCAGNDDDGIFLYSSYNNSLSDNNCTGNYFGITISRANNNTLSGNNCTGNSVYEIYLYSSPNCTLSGNFLGRGGLFLEGPVSSLIPTIIDTTNTANGSPIRFLANTNGTVIPANTGEVILVNCSDITVNQQPNPGAFILLINSFSNIITGNNCTGFRYGIYLSSSTNNTLSGNTCTGNFYGIYLSSSNNNTITGNNCTENSRTGIRLLSSSCNNTLSGNNCTGNNETGIYLFDACSNNTLSLNNCNWNSYNGIVISYSDNNTLSENTCTGNQLTLLGFVGVSGSPRAVWDLRLQRVYFQAGY